MIKFKTAGGHRSGFESEVTKFLKMAKVVHEYEPKDKKVSYTKPATKHLYLPDYVLPNGVYVECKGRWTASERKKLIYIKECNPELDIRLVFQQPANKLSSKSKTTYAQWCDKNKVKWGTKADILLWSKE